jgi:mitochondrial splicing suppressor protein 51
LLPTEDLENPCLTALVEQIISELIVSNVVVNKAAKPWLLFEAICIIARVLQQEQTMSDDKPANIPGTKQRRWSVHGLFVWLMAWALLAMSSLRVCFATLLAASSLPTRIGRASNQSVINHEADDNNVNPAGKADREPVPVLEYRLWPALANVMELGSRMPWLDGILSLLKHGAINGPWRPAAVDGALDR